MSHTPTLDECITAAIESRLKEVHTGMPAKVTRYDVTKQLCDAAPLIKTRFLDESGAAIVQELPVVTNIPVVFPGSGNFGLTFPVAVGDVVWLAFSESSLDKWKSQGGTVDPVDPRRHALADAVAVVGLRPFNSPFAGDGQFITIGSKDGQAQFVALANKVLDELVLLKDVFTAWTPVPNDGGAVLKTALTTLITGGWPHSVASATVKIKG